MKKIVGVVVALLAATLMSPAAVAAPVLSAASASEARADQALTLRATVKSTETVTYGGPDGIGDLTVTHGAVRDEAGRAAGSMTMVMRVISVRDQGRQVMQDTQVQVRLGRGQIFAQAVAAYSSDGKPEGTRLMSVTGGTGAYATAHGTLKVTGSGKDLRLAYDISVSEGLKTSTMKFSDLTAKRVKGDAKAGIGNVILTRAAKGKASYVSVATRVGAAEGRGIQSTDIQVFTADGSIFGRTVVQHGKGHKAGHVYAVLGGTGSQKGVRGEMLLSEDGRTLTLRLLGASGKATLTEWWEDNGDGVEELPIVGATFTGLYGKMYEGDDGAKTIGHFYVTRMVYDQVGGVTPVVTMLEQDFGDGTMIISGITLATGVGGKAVTRPIVGGTGAYQDADGQVSSMEEPSGLWKKQGRFWR